MRTLKLTALLGSILLALTTGVGGPGAAASPRGAAAGGAAPGSLARTDHTERRLDFAIERLSGTDRYAAAAAISREFSAPAHGPVVIASGEVFADGVAAGPLAARLAAPVLFVTRTRIPQASAAELSRLRPSRIYVLGGPETVSDAVLSALSAWTDEAPVRVGGADRYAVAAAASRHAFPGPLESVFVASGQVWPDALTGGAAAAIAGSPMLITPADRVPEAVESELRRLAPSRILLLGGPASVGASTEAALSRIAPVERVWGADRYATALAISARFFGSDRPAMMIATGANYPDALAGSAHAITTRGPIVLSSGATLARGTTTELARLRPATAYLLGGTASVPIEIPRAVQRELGVCWAGAPPTDSRIEVISAIAGTRSPQLAFTLDMGGRMDGAADIVRFLIDNQVCTTFFPTSIMADTPAGHEVMGLIAQHPELFEVGNHTVHHCDLVRGGGGSPSSEPCARDMTSTFVRSQVRDAEPVLARLAGFSIRPYWRPPFGSHDATVRAIAAAAGFPKTMLWNRDTVDWDPETTTADIVNSVISPTPDSGTIVLAHLGGYNTGAALETIVPTLRARGFTFTTISDMYDD